MGGWRKFLGIGGNLLGVPAFFLGGGLTARRVVGFGRWKVLVADGGVVRWVPGVVFVRFPCRKTSFYRYIFPPGNSFTR